MTNRRHLCHFRRPQPQPHHNEPVETAAKTIIYNNNIMIIIIVLKYINEPVEAAAKTIGYDVCSQAPRHLTHYQSHESA